MFNFNVFHRRHCTKLSVTYLNVSPKDRPHTEGFMSIFHPPSVFAPPLSLAPQPPGAQAKTAEGNVMGDAVAAAGDGGGNADQEDPEAPVAPAVTKSIQYCTNAILNTGWQDPAANGSEVSTRMNETQIVVLLCSVL